jgi:hypothetical protein
MPATRHRADPHTASVRDHASSVRVEDRTGHGEDAEESNDVESRRRAKA